MPNPSRLQPRVRYYPEPSVIVSDAAAEPVEILIPWAPSGFDHRAVPIRNLEGPIFSDFKKTAALGRKKMPCPWGFPMDRFHGLGKGTGEEGPDPHFSG